MEFTRERPLALPVNRRFVLARYQFCLSFVAGPPHVIPFDPWPPNNSATTVNLQFTADSYEKPDEKP
ncbi:hypothetical protein THTE_1234 [Thermogutta terrifontis]|uniref:Uncharacterized protein n=1 Tax=Thermogutta terrifontis TaxID=1331910 RepID=A0A286RD00_9BACT|nr:hypothetical protein THTE_1234 [Thermogutta terrifontis]